MKSTTKMMILFISIFAILFAIPMVSNAAETETATDESTLRSAIENVNDGGTVEYKALTYKVSKVHRLTGDLEKEYEDGTIIEILGFEVFNNVK